MPRYPRLPSVRTCRSRRCSAAFVHFKSTLPDRKQRSGLVMTSAANPNVVPMRALAELLGRIFIALRNAKLLTTIYAPLGKSDTNHFAVFHTDLPHRLLR